MNREEACVLFEKYKVANSFGTVICQDCAAGLQNIMKSENLYPAEKLLWLDVLSDSIHENESGSDISHPLSDRSEDSAKILFEQEKNKRKLACLAEFLELSQCSYKPWVTEKYSTFSSPTKSTFLCRTRAILKTVLSVLAPNDTEEVMKDIFAEGESKHDIVLDGNFVKIMRGVSFAYKNADDWPTRRAILSIVAPQISHKMICTFLPGLTLYRFTSARMHAATMGTGVIVEPRARVVTRFHEAQVRDFVNFITSSQISIDLPFGEKVLKLKDGTELFVPNVIRNFVPSRIIQQYYRYCDEVSPNFPPLSISSLLKILETCKASTRRSLAGIDYFQADAAEAFDSLEKMLQDLSP